MKHSKKLMMLMVFAAAMSIFTPAAEACKDCPFPMKVGDHVWQMPNSPLQVQIFERELSDCRMLMFISLWNSESKEKIASSVVTRNCSQRLLNFVLFDLNGGRINGTLNLIDFAETIQAKFTCETKGACAIESDPATVSRF